MENLQEALDKLRTEREAFLKDANEKVNLQLAWYEGGIAQLEAILNPQKDEENEDKTAA